MPTRVSSFHTMSLDLLASVYEKPCTEPVWRPNKPWRLGPILLPSPSPRVWHCAHRVLKRLAPFFASPRWEVECQPTLLARPKNAAEKPPKIPRCDNLSQPCSELVQNMSTGHKSYTRFISSWAERVTHDKLCWKLLIYLDDVVDRGEGKSNVLMTATYTETLP